MNLPETTQRRKGLLSPSGIVSGGLIWIVRAYQAATKWKPPTCRYIPSCSEYAIGAIRSRGPIVGVALAAWRILRCNPFSRGGYDPAE
jgi:putative membrane protein insertion efficiency factor